MPKVFERYTDNLVAGSEAVSLAAQPVGTKGASFKKFARELKHQTKDMKKAYKSGGRKKRSEEWYKERGEKALKLFAEAMRKRNKMLKEVISKSGIEEHNDTINMANGENTVDEMNLTRNEEREDMPLNQVAENEKAKKAFRKQLKRQNKFLKKICKSKSDDGQTNEGAPVENMYQTKEDKSAGVESATRGTKPFWQKLGNVVLKVLPNLLCIAVKSFFQWMFGGGKRKVKNYA